MDTNRDPVVTAALDAALNGDGLTIAKFQTRACVICRRLEPGLKAVAEQMVGKLRVIGVDAEANPSLAERHNVHGVPTLVLFKGGTEIDRCNGFQSASMLRDWLAPHLDR